MHYHGTPITPMTALYQLAGRSFCVSFARPDQVKQCHNIGQSVMLDNGAFSMWRAGKPTNWSAYYDWSDKWLAYPTTWAVIPDVIDGGATLQDDLLAQWPHGDRGAPVWHMDEPIERLVRLTDSWSRVCIGSTSVYATVLSDSWCARMDDAWDAVARAHSRLPQIHMLRGMQCVGRRWPFASVDSTDIGRNHSRPDNVAWAMVDRWDAVQCPSRWNVRKSQPGNLFDERLPLWAN
jgi:hypothetical protein